MLHTYPLQSRLSVCVCVCVCFIASPTTGVGAFSNDNYIDIQVEYSSIENNKEFLFIFRFV